MLSLENVSVEYRQQNQAFYALKEINLDLREGECLAIVGKSGCGKTTLLNVMAGLLKPDTGKVKYQGAVVDKPTSEISMIFQNYGLFPWKTVRQNMTLPLKLKKKKIDEASVLSLAKQLELENQLHKYPSQLSGGQKQRVAIGRALLNNAKIVLMDEPFSAVDELTKESMEQHLKELFYVNQITSVLVTHSIEEAILWGDRIVIFHPSGGRIQSILQNPQKGRTDGSILQMKHQIKELFIGEVNEI
jgi:NitT/TauT family transport system ATP-binding protein